MCPGRIPNITIHFEQIHPPTGPAGTGQQDGQTLPVITADLWHLDNRRQGRGNQLPLNGSTKIAAQSFHSLNSGSGLDLDFQGEEGDEVDSASAKWQRRRRRQQRRSGSQLTLRTSKSHLRVDCWTRAGYPGNGATLQQQPEYGCGESAPRSGRKPCHTGHPLTRGDENSYDQYGHRPGHTRGARGAI